MNMPPVAEQKRGLFVRKTRAQKWREVLFSAIVTILVVGAMYLLTDAVVLRELGSLNSWYLSQVMIGGFFIFCVGARAREAWHHKDIEPSTKNPT